MAEAGLMARGIFIIGAGSMAEAFIRGVTARGAMAPERVAVVNRRRPERIAELSARYGVREAASWAEMSAAGLVVVAVKPGDVGDALAQAAPFLTGQPVLSFAAGVPISYMQEKIGRRSPVVRTMPNIPVAVQAGVTAVAFDEQIRPQDREDVLFLLRQLGEVVELPETRMDAVTALCGSGPGFLCYILEAMEDAAADMGFTRDEARRLLVQTLAGTAEVLRAWGISPAELRARVTSPNGTTHAGVTAMEQAGLKHVVAAALTAAARRAEELGRTYRG
ncbi:pyrroline-5-carboxylate reductase 2 [Alicyclobacillus cellulosilyticus]|uniref:Pyrroline-5-carboxylate reductase n=1 Tax=Alicyclobacillus cellulosilyticus TaxID=1003997 RepID=A0A917K9V5_9BACL|nr:pyrroline-5-carboxylate reductase [Alicyclobacillus cellulosilyticus]GGJ05290.1 pyrroline-5-carboxylate reductase 2 [Alicyclobacillus cellulosilyticus]